MPRAEFSKATKLEAFTKCGGKCQQCLQRLITPPEYHHIVEAALNGTNDLSNCQVLCKKCHRLITDTQSIPLTARANRISEKRAGVRKTNRGFRKAPAGFNTWTRRFEN